MGLPDPSESHCDHEAKMLKVTPPADVQHRAEAVSCQYVSSPDEIHSKYDSPGYVCIMCGKELCEKCTFNDIRFDGSIKPNE